MTTLTIETKHGTIVRHTKHDTYDSALADMAWVISVWEAKGWDPETSSQHIRSLMDGAYPQHRCVYVWDADQRVARVQIVPDGVYG